MRHSETKQPRGLYGGAKERLKGRNSKGKGTRVWEEDATLMRLVKKMGPHDWKAVAKAVPGRTGKSCRLRWQNHLDPNVDKTPLTEEEERTVVLAYAEFGSRWSAIARRLPRRTDNTIKNYWHSTLKKNYATLLAEIAQLQQARESSLQRHQAGPPINEGSPSGDDLQEEEVSNPWEGAHVLPLQLNTGSNEAATSTTELEQSASSTSFPAFEPAALGLGLRSAMGSGSGCLRTLSSSSASSITAHLPQAGQLPAAANSDTCQLFPSPMGQLAPDPLAQLPSEKPRSAAAFPHNFASNESWRAVGPLTKRPRSASAEEEWRGTCSEVLEADQWDGSDPVLAELLQMCESQRASPHVAALDSLSSFGQEPGPGLAEVQAAKEALSAKEIAAEFLTVEALLRADFPPQGPQYIEQGVDSSGELLGSIVLSANNSSEELASLYSLHQATYREPNSFPLYSDSVLSYPHRKAPVSSHHLVASHLHAASSACTAVSFPAEKGQRLPSGLATAQSQRKRSASTLQAPALSHSEQILATPATSQQLPPRRSGSELLSFLANDFPELAGMARPVAPEKDWETEVVVAQWRANVMDRQLSELQASARQRMHSKSGAQGWLRHDLENIFSRPLAGSKWSL